MILISIIDAIFWVYMLMLFVRIIGSWFPEFSGHTLMRFLAFYTDPYLNFFKKFIPPIGMFDFSPIVAFFALQLLEAILKSLVAYLL